MAHKGEKVLQTNTQASTQVLPVHGNNKTPSVIKRAAAVTRCCNGLLPGYMRQLADIRGKSSAVLKQRDPGRKGKRVPALLHAKTLQSDRSKKVFGNKAIAEGILANLDRN